MLNGEEGHIAGPKQEQRQQRPSGQVIVDHGGSLENHRGISAARRYATRVLGFYSLCNLSAPPGSSRRRLSLLVSDSRTRFAFSVVVHAHSLSSIRLSMMISSRSRSSSSCVLSTAAADRSQLARMASSTICARSAGDNASHCTVETPSPPTPANERLSPGLAGAVGRANSTICCGVSAMRSGMNAASASVMSPMKAPMSSTSDL